MSKRIIFCADGTWDTPGSASNVYKIFKAIPVLADQFPSYDDGLGADGTPLEKLTGGAFGQGIFQKIKDGYTKIAQLYDANDELFLFGFSRGAYTARSLAGMIAICGLPVGTFDNNLVDAAFDAYRNPNQRDAILARLGKYNLFDAKLTMVGVWDTVGSLGIPAVFGGVSNLLYGFLDAGLHPDVLHAYHALSIDERRVEFPATLWNAETTVAQVVEQVWFSGVHSDVGGGYAETGLSDITLSWMMNKAKALGIQFDPAIWSKYALVDAKHSLDLAHESWNPSWLFPRRRNITTDSSISNTARIRYQESDYRPPNLNTSDSGFAATYTIVQVVAPPQPIASVAALPGTSISV